MEKKSTRRMRLLLFLLFSFGYTVAVNAQSCHCDTTVQKNTHKFFAGAVQPGQTICIDTGVRTTNLVFYGVQGAPGNRITIRPSCGGKVLFKMAGWMSFAIKFDSSSRYFRFTGTGSSDFYGIVVDSSSQGLQLINHATDFEIDHIEFKNIGFAGVMAKTDNSGRSAAFVMKNVSFHDIYVHKTSRGEGFYIGNTSWMVNGNQHDIDSLECYNNITDSTASDGIQVGCTYSGNARVYNNRVTNAGYSPFGNFQSSGMQLGNGFSGWCYNNYVGKPRGNGITVLGPGNVYVVNNVIDQHGEIGIYSGKATAEAGKTYHFLHNTFIQNDSAPAIKTDPRTNSFFNIYNNAVVRADTTFTETFVKSDAGVWDTGGNVIRSTAAPFNFENAAAGNYDLLPGSVAINAGVNIDSLNIHWDFENRTRPVGQYDAGAYEAQAPPNVFRVNAGGLEVADTLVNWAKDKQTDPCDWLAPGSANLTTGSDQPWGGTNNTDAPKQIFSTNRYAGASGNQVNYEFPVSNGVYTVRLYFAENSIQAAGQRVFDVNIEGVNKMNDFDIYATAGYKVAYKASFTVTVTDGVLDVDIIRVTGNPQINGIAIDPAGTVASGRMETPALTTKETIVNKITAFPVPLQNKLYVQQQGAVSSIEEVNVQLVNATGVLLYEGKHRFSGGYMTPVDLSGLAITPGVYFLRLSGVTTNGVIRLLKQ